jgi:hypothetical protein
MRNRSVPVIFGSPLVFLFITCFDVRYFTVCPQVYLFASFHSQKRRQFFSHKHHWALQLICGVCVFVLGTSWPSFSTYRINSFCWIWFPPLYYFHCLGLIIMTSVPVSSVPMQVMFCLFLTFHSWNVALNVTSIALWQLLNWSLLFLSLLWVNASCCVSSSE